LIDRAEKQTDTQTNGGKNRTSATGVGVANDRWMMKMWLNELTGKDDVTCARRGESGKERLVQISSKVSNVNSVWQFSINLAFHRYGKLTCHMGSHSVTCHPTEVRIPPLPQPKQVLDLATPEGCKAELTYNE